MPKRILVIDDDEDLLEIFDIIFREAGYQVIMSNTAQAADHIHFISPNLIMLDIRFAATAKNGAEICREFKSAYPEALIPVMLVSAEYDLQFLAGDCGADAYMSKPFDIGALLKKVEELIP